MLATSLVSGALWWHFSGWGGGLHAHLCPEGSSLLRETGRCEVADHICHGPVHRAAAGRLTLDTPGDKRRSRHWPTHEEEFGVISPVSCCFMKVGAFKRESQHICFFQVHRKSSKVVSFLSCSFFIPRLRSPDLQTN